MKKIFIFLLSSLLLLSFIFVFGCDKKSNYLNYVSELKSNLYCGESEMYKLEAFSGYREDPYIKDGKVGEKAERLIVSMVSASESPTNYTFIINFNSIEYKQTASSEYDKKIIKAEFEIDNFNVNNFDILVVNGSLNDKVSMHSILPSGTLDYNTELLALENSQKELLNNYIVDGKFCAEIYMRVIVKDDMPYWYVGIATENDLKAFLMDGKTGEVLAIRSVF